MLEYQTRRSRAHLSTYCPTFSFYLSSFSVRRRLRYVRHHSFIVHILMLAVQSHLRALYSLDILLLFCERARERNRLYMLEEKIER